MRAGERRGLLRTWRKVNEAFDKDVIEERTEGYQDGMMWACFAFNAKGPCYFWYKETAEERERLDNLLTQENEAEYWTIVEY